MEITANTIQPVNAGSHVLFTETVIPGNCSMIHSDGSGLITLRGLTNQCRARFRVSFTANVAAPTGSPPPALSLAIATNGEPITSTTAIITPAAANQYHNVTLMNYLDVPRGCCTQLSINNISSVTVSIANANLLVERVA